MDTETVRAAMRALYARTHQSDCEDKFIAIAEWWRLQSLESLSPVDCLLYADGQEKLARDMEERPLHYATKPLDKTCWQWSEIPHLGTTP